MPLVMAVSRTTRCRAHIQRCWRLRLTKTSRGRSLAVQGVRTGLATTFTGAEGARPCEFGAADGGADVTESEPGGVAAVPSPDPVAEQPARTSAPITQRQASFTVTTLGR